LFITYGDLFLPQPSDYDDLYYELIRDAKAIETFHYYGSSTTHAQRTHASLVNMTREA
jgi:hypothetical protein